MGYLDYTNLTFFNKFSLLWCTDPHFSSNIIMVGFTLSVCILIIYICGINFLYMIMPGGRVYGDPSTTSFPRWLPIICLIFIALFYTVYKINNTNFVMTGFGKYNCEYKSALGLVIDEQFRWGSLLSVFIITFVYALWFRES